MRQFLFTLVLVLASCTPFLNHSAIVRADVIAPEDGVMVEVGSGTAFAISPHYWLTAGHVCRKVGVDGQRLLYEGAEFTVISANYQKDICLLHSDKAADHWFRISTSEPQVDDKIYTVGYPLGSPVQLTTAGTIAGVFEEKEGLFRYMMSCQAFGGNSGGPVLNSSGDVVGILIEGVTVYPQLSISVTLQDIQDFLQE